VKHVYCIEAVSDRGRESNALKVGVASKPYSRLKELQVANHCLLHMRVVIPCEWAHELERELHSWFSMARIRGEWFRCEDWLIEDMGRLASLFASLSEPQRDLLRCVRQSDGWLYRFTRGRESGDLPSWLRAAA
jgi:hypothetical protein